MEIKKNFDLTKYNTFGVQAVARFFVEINSEKDLVELFTRLEFKQNERLFLGGGSNILFTKDFDGIVVFNRLKGIEILHEDDENVLLKSMGGEWWNDLVNFSVEHKYWGIENLALIPGTVGATPVQNIGAYGVELKDILDQVEAYEIATGQKIIFTNAECKFGYRDSIFKNEFRGKYFISAVVLKLNKIEKKNIRYKTLEEYLDKNKIEAKNSKDIASAIAEIRRSKLPDPKILGNAGSFFKNIFVSEEKLSELQNKFPEMPFFQENNIIKIPAGWLIEQCGWKGKRLGNVGVHDKQALVLVNYGGSTGEEIKNLSNQINDSVYQKFGLKLILEVNFI